MTRRALIIKRLRQGPARNADLCELLRTHSADVARTMSALVHAGVIDSTSPGRGRPAVYTIVTEREMTRRDLIAQEMHLAATYRREAKSRRAKNPALADQFERWADASTKRAEELRCGPLFGGADA